MIETIVLNQNYEVTVRELVGDKYINTNFLVEAENVTDAEVKITEYFIKLMNPDEESGEIARQIEYKISSVKFSKFKKIIR